MAIQPNTGEIAWEVKTRTPMGGGMLGTGGGLIFTGDAEGNFTAYDSKNGKILWSYQTGSGIRARQSHIDWTVSSTSPLHLEWGVRSGDTRAQARRG